MAGIKEMERQSLEVHVDLCAERFENMDNRMGLVENRLAKVETIVSDIKQLLIEKETMAYKKLIGIGVGIIGSLLTALMGLVIYVAKIGKF